MVLVGSLVGLVCDFDCGLVVVDSVGRGLIVVVVVVRVAPKSRRTPSQHSLIQQVTDKPTHQFFHR